LIIEEHKILGNKDMGWEGNNCLPVFLVNYRLVLIITSKTELEISGHVVQWF